MFQSEISAPTPGTDFVCDCRDGAHSACAGEPFYKEHEGKRYCVLHYPSKEKATDFKRAFQKKIAAEDYNFRGAWFPDKLNLSDIVFKANVDFYYARFSAVADFEGATFSAGANFKKAIFITAANFSFATFSANANFYSARFSANATFYFARFSAVADFERATFNAHAYFHYAAFSANVDFSFATFNADATFRSATFNADATFYYATFQDEVKFSDVKSFGDQSYLALQFARIEKPERFSFHTVKLRPLWFINVDSRKFVFTDVSWEWDTFILDRRLLAITCRQLAENAEGNNRYEEASRFRYWAMDLARRYKWAGFAFWKTDWLHMLYWAVSGYGERILRAFGWLLAIWIIFALLYTKVGFTEPLPFKRSITYSLAVMSLQKPEPRPLTNSAQTFVLLETIFGPLQVALLALAIRRKFMR